MTREEAVAKFKDIIKAELNRMPCHYDSEIKDYVYNDIDKANEILELNKIVCEAVERWNLAEQYKWERDVALEQLKEIGCTFGQKMDDVKAAVEKQTAKNPIRTSRATEILQGSEYSCPACGMLTLDNIPSYCCNCGCKIDWTEEQI